jgi:surfeit locus 1 family protein
MKNYISFSWKITTVGVLLSLLMIRLSYWQWNRHLEKIELIKTMDARLNLEPVLINTLLPQIKENPDLFIHRRFKLSGTYDFKHEIILRNRRFNKIAGVFVVTPLLISGTTDTVLVSRGFIPLTEADQISRKRYQKPLITNIIGLVKPSLQPKFFLAPSDPKTGKKLPWVDAWLRINIPEISKQLPYQPLPIWLEKMDNSSIAKIKKEILNNNSDRDEILNLAARTSVSKTVDLKDYNFPEPVYDIIIPPGRHFGYVFEWLAMATITLFITLILQFKRFEFKKKSDYMKQVHL